MNRLTHRQALLAGLVIILATNAVALGGAAWNRQGVPDSSLQLTQREFSDYGQWRFNKDDSGIALHLDWNTDPRDESGLLSSYFRGQPSWLDTRKLAELGFEVSRPASFDPLNPRSFLSTEREVLLVLELNGPAYRSAVEKARQRAVEDEDEDIAQRRKELQELLHESTRLYVVDAGLDRTALRQRHPDRRQYAIVRGIVSAGWQDAREPQLQGSIGRLSVEEINLPQRFRQAFLANEGDGNKSSLTPFEAEVAFGRRLEPWLKSYRPGAAGK